MWKKVDAAAAAFSFIEKQNKNQTIAHSANGFFTIIFVCFMLHPNQYLFAPCTFACYTFIK